MDGSSEQLTLDPVPPAASRADQVTGRLRAAILSGRIRPGEVLVERRLSEMLGVSKTPVREALIALTGTGLVTPARNGRVMVRRPDRHELGRIFSARLLVEPPAFAAAAAQADGTYRERARAALDRVPALKADNDNVQIALVNREFHRWLYAGCGNEFVVDMLDRLQDLSALASLAVLEDSPQPADRDELAEHRDILTSFEAHNAAQAENLARTHIQVALDILLDRRPQPADGA